MKARPLGNYCAVEPVYQGDTLQKIGKILVPYHVPDRINQALIGRVLATGKNVSGVTEGDIVIFEKHSGHPGQTWKIESTVFGGDEGKFAILMPCWKVVPEDELESDRGEGVLAVINDYVQEQ
tara:strand:- start:2047 stop:2415 length:369 start_codon:yes stop_codon:yes gene_type:complete